MPTAVQAPGGEGIRTGREVLSNAVVCAVLVVIARAAGRGSEGLH